jgi:hypothetical protein
MDGRYVPILRTIFSASLAYFLLAAFHFDDLTSPEPFLILWFVAGLAYTNLFEYWVHRFPMHRVLPLLGFVRRDHLEHHRVFHGANFRTANPADMARVAGRYWMFPILLGGHYAVVGSVLPVNEALVFLFGCYLHYVAFEGTHWLTHVQDNAIDRVLGRLPIVGPFRARQIEHHRIHHEIPVGAYNFNPPYLGDALAGRAVRPRSAPVQPRPRVALPLAAAVIRRPGRYRTALAVLGLMAVGVVAIAHWKTSRPSPVSRLRS